MTRSRVKNMKINLCWHVSNHNTLCVSYNLPILPQSGNVSLVSHCLKGFAEPCPKVIKALVTHNEFVRCTVVSQSNTSIIINHTKEFRV